MKVFISWSGESSKAVAASLRKHLPLILQGLSCFMSKHDLESGARWAQELGEELEESNFGILCLTHESLTSPWLLFEAGSLVKHSYGRACGLLIGDLDATDIEGPLAQFQHRKFEHSEILQLLKDLNSKLEKSLASDDLRRLFDKFWPDIEEEYRASLKVVAPKPVRRKERAILEELLTRVRGLEVEQHRGEVAPSASGGDILSRPVTVDSLGWYSLWKFPNKQVSERIQAFLLRDLDERQYQTIGDIDDAINRARAAVEAYEKENPDFFKFSTDYITKSLGFVDPGFRSRHGFAARTLEAFDRYGGLVENSG